MSNIIKNTLSELEPVLPLYFGKQEYEQLCRISELENNILITGNQGLPFELAAQFVHLKGKSNVKPFIIVDYISESPGEFEKSLFGASTVTSHDLKNTSKGFLQDAKGGSIYFSDLSMLSSTQQQVLMNTIDRGYFFAVGSKDRIAVDTRIIGKTDKNIDELLQKGIIRTDFYFWISNVTITLASLHGRKDDITGLAENLLQDFNSKYEKSIEGFTEEALERIKSFTWIGEIIQLQNAIEHSVIVCDSNIISIPHLPEYLKSEAIDKKSDTQFVKLKEATDEFQRQYIQNTLKSCSFDKEIAANKLGIGLSTLYRKMEELKI